MWHSGFISSPPTASRPRPFTAPSKKLILAKWQNPRCVVFKCLVRSAASFAVLLDGLVTTFAGWMSMIHLTI